MVFRALCTDPETGLPIEPQVIFRRLDTDGGGTVDVDEFHKGLQLCGCELTDEELELVWAEIDGADGESDGEV
jgi:Ca2+-binding EF-hand superfamily protein